PPPISPLSREPRRPPARGWTCRWLSSRHLPPTAWDALSWVRAGGGGRTPPCPTRSGESPPEESQDSGRRGYLAPESAPKVSRSGPTPSRAAAGLGTTGCPGPVPPILGICRSPPRTARCPSGSDLAPGPEGPGDRAEDTGRGADVRGWGLAGRGSGADPRARGGGGRASGPPPPRGQVRGPRPPQGALAVLALQLARQVHFRARSLRSGGTEPEARGAPPSCARSPARRLPQDFALRRNVPPEARALHPPPTGARDPGADPPPDPPDGGRSRTAEPRRPRGEGERQPWVGGRGAGESLGTLPHFGEAGGPGGGPVQVSPSPPLKSPAMVSSWTSTPPRVSGQGRTRTGHRTRGGYGGALPGGELRGAREGGDSSREVRGREVQLPQRPGPPVPSPLPAQQEKAGPEGSVEEAALSLQKLYQLSVALVLNVLGTESMRQGRCGSAFSCFLQAAARGYAKAQYNAGLCLELGRGTRRDLSQALLYYERAASRGHLLAQYRYARCLLREPAAEAGHRGASSALERLAEGGLTEAQAFLGVWLIRGPHRDERRAVHFFRLAAANGDPQSQYHLGVCHELGLGVQRDVGTAARCYRRAAAQGNPRARERLSLLLPSPPAR
uniref:DAP3-binding cell death enhancer 1 n=1 Tax=Ornithorhynchus anatinus TaxID=9258 RepID=A0A6I8NU23_ORNAN